MEQFALSKTINERKLSHLIKDNIYSYDLKNKYTGDTLPQLNEKANLKQRKTSFDMAASRNQGTFDQRSNSIIVGHNEGRRPLRDIFPSIMSPMTSKNPQNPQNQESIDVSFKTQSETFNTPNSLLRDSQGEIMELNEYLGDQNLNNVEPTLFGTHTQSGDNRQGPQFASGTAFEAKDRPFIVINSEKNIQDLNSMRQASTQVGFMSNGDFMMEKNRLFDLSTKTSNLSMLSNAQPKIPFNAKVLNTQPNMSPTGSSFYFYRPEKQRNDFIACRNKMSYFATQDKLTQKQMMETKLGANHLRQKKLSICSILGQGALVTNEKKRKQLTNAFNVGHTILNSSPRTMNVSPQKLSPERNLNVKISEAFLQSHIKPKSFVTNDFLLEKEGSCSSEEDLLKKIQREEQDLKEVKSESSIHESDEDIMTPVNHDKNSARGSSKLIVYTDDQLVSPDKVKLSFRIQKEIYDLKKDFNCVPVMNSEQHKLLFKICRYYAADCRFTANPSEWSKILNQYRKGFLGLVGLQNELARVAQKYDLAEKELFASQYSEKHVVNEDPTNNIDAYLWDENPKKVIRFTDKVVYYKRKMEKLGKRTQEKPLVFIHKKRIDDQIEPETQTLMKDTSQTPIFKIEVTDMTFNDSYIHDDNNFKDSKSFDYRHTRAFQNNPQLCEIAMKANKVMYDNYDWDKRYEIDKDELSRLNKSKCKDCGEHGSHNDAKLQRMSQYQMMTETFYKDLIDPKNRKISHQVQANYFVKIIKDTQNDKDFQFIRNILKDLLDSKKEIEFKELNKRMPLLFLKQDPNEITEDSRDDGYYSLDKSYLFKVRNKVIEILGEGGLQNFIQNDDPRCQRVMQKLEDKSLYYATEKAISANPKGEQNPQHNYDNYLRLNNEIRAPIFQKIENGRLHLDGYPISKKQIIALSQYIKEITQKALEKDDSINKENTYFFIKSLHIDNQFTEQDFCRLLDACNTQNSLKQISILNLSLEQPGVNSLEKVIEKKFPNSTLEYLRLSNIKTRNEDFINNLLHILEDNTILKYLQLNQMNLNSLQTTQLLTNQINLNSKLCELDLSYCVFMPKIFKEFCANLAVDAAQKSLRVLNLSHINIKQKKGMRGTFDKEIIPLRKKRVKVVIHHHVEEMAQNIGIFMLESHSLQVLKLDGMNWGEDIKPIIQAMSKITWMNLLSLHISDNGFDQETIAYIYKKLNISTHDMHLTNQVEQGKGHIDNLHREQIYTKRFKMKAIVHKFYSKQQQEHISTNDILKADFEKQKKLEAYDVMPKTQRQNHVLDPLILTRKINHQELIFNEQLYSNTLINNYNHLHKWNANYEFDYGPEQRASCYVSQQHSYVQLFLDLKGGTYEKISDPEVLRSLKEQIQMQLDDNVQKGQKSDPILMSSINEWIPTKFIDLRLYCQILKQTNPQLTLELQKNVRYYVEDMIRNPKVQLKEYLAQLPENSLIDEASPETLQKFQKEQDMKQVEQAQANLQRAMKDNIDIESPQCIDFLTEYGIKDILAECKTWKRDHLVQIDCPAELLEDPFKKDKTQKLSRNYQLFAGYVRPGFHTIVIYEPISAVFYQKTVYIKAREGYLDIHNASNRPEEKVHNTLVKEASLENDLIDTQAFIFKDMNFQSKQRLNDLFEFDFISNLGYQSAIPFGPKLIEEMNKKILLNVKTHYGHFLELYKMFVIFQEYPQINYSKLVAFLVEINLISENTTSETRVMLHKIENLVDKDLQVTRPIFTYFIYQLTIVMYQIQKPKIQSIVPDKIIEFFESKVLGPFVKKKFFDLTTEEFRKEYVWKEKTNNYLTKNKNHLNQIYHSYQTKVKRGDAALCFTLQSALDMLQDAKINLDKSDRLQQHLENKKIEKEQKKAFKLIMEEFEETEATNKGKPNKPPKPIPERGLEPFLPKDGQSENEVHIRVVTNLFGLSKDLVIQHNTDPYMSLNFEEFQEFILRLARCHFNLDNFPKFDYYSQILMHEPSNIQLYELFKRHLFPGVGISVKPKQKNLVGKGPVLDEWAIDKFKFKLTQLKAAGYVIPGDKEKVKDNAEPQKKKEEEPTQMEEGEQQEEGAVKVKKKGEKILVYYSDDEKIA